MEKSYTIIDTTPGMDSASSSEATCLRVAELPGNHAIRVTVALMSGGGNEMRVDLTREQWKHLCDLRYDLKVEDAVDVPAALPVASAR